jgi:hypothetical protein
MRALEIALYVVLALSLRAANASVADATKNCPARVNKTINKTDQVAAVERVTDVLGSGGTASAEAKAKTTR